MKNDRKTVKTRQKTGILLCALLILLSSAAWAQDRSKISVYIPMPEGGTNEQREYFYNSFKMELVGANYPLAPTREKSAYTLLLTINDSPYFKSHADRVDESLMPYELMLRLVRSENNNEIVMMSFFFDTPESMNGWNLYLLYNLLANAWADDDTALNQMLNDRWRNQTLYLPVCAGVDFGYYLRRDDGKIQTGIVAPALLAGVEWQFFDFFSAELDVKPRFMEDQAPALAASLTGRAVLKFGAVMLELYGGGEFSVGLGISVPWLSVIGGVQAGVRAAPQSAWILDYGFTRNFVDSYNAANGTGYDLIRFHTLAGIKFGFKDRKPLILNK
jgi:hypothetical protein